MRALIMGGTSGIGLATARRLTDAGHEVVVTGRDPARLDGARPYVATAEELDATDVEAVGALFDRLGPVDHLVLCFSPGPVGLGTLDVVDLADVRTAYEQKALAYLGVVQQAHTRGAVRGSIVMLSAATARAAIPGSTALAMANGAIERAVSPLAAELAPVRVNVVSPGSVDTPWWSFLDEEQRAAQFAQAAAAVPAHRVGRPEDVADAIAYLLTADYVTGSVLPVDGGLTVA